MTAFPAAQEINIIYDISSCMKPLKHQFVHHVHSSTSAAVTSLAVFVWSDMILASDLGGVQIYIMAIVHDVCIHLLVYPTFGRIHHGLEAFCRAVQHYTTDFNISLFVPLEPGFPPTTLRRRLLWRLGACFRNFSNEQDRTIERPTPEFEDIPWWCYRGMRPSQLLSVSVSFGSYLQ